jgi:hypothetical protein
MIAGEQERRAARGIALENRRNVGLCEQKSGITDAIQGVFPQFCLFGRHAGLEMSNIPYRLGGPK